ncbi:MAG: hypothetical protein AAGB93_09620 [Planctomycetota bacterium]
MKLVRRLLVVLVLGVVLLGVAAALLVPPAASSAIDRGTRHAFGVGSSLGRVKASIGPATTGLGFSEFALSSPDGFEEPLLTIGGFGLGVGTRSILGGVKEVDELVLEDVVLTLEQRGTANNLVPILQHLRSRPSAQDTNGGSAEAPSEEPATAGDPGPRLRVGRIRVSGIAARLRLGGIVGIDDVDERYEVPAFERDLSEMTADGRTVSEIAGLILEDLQQRAIGSAEGHVPDPVLAALRSTLEGGLEGGLGAAEDALRSELEGQAEELQGEAASKVDEAVDKAGKELQKGLDGLLKGGG